MSTASRQPKVLITGGAGFIGSTLAGKLISGGSRLVLVDTLHPDVHGTNPSPPKIDGARFVHGDVTSSLMWDRLLREYAPDVVVHLAAETGTGQSLFQATRHASVNIVGTTEMLDALHRANHRPDHFVLASSRAVYGEGQWKVGHDTFYPEPRTAAELADKQWDPRAASGEVARSIKSTAGVTEARPTNIYAATKLAQEHILIAWTAATGSKLSILRLQNVYGPGQSLLNPYTGVLALFAKLAVGGEVIDLYEDGQAIRDFVYIDDVVDAIHAAIKLPPGIHRTLDIGSGSAVTLAEVAGLMAEREGAPAPEVSGRFRAGDIRAAACDIGAAADDLGYVPAHDLRAGLGRLLDWVKVERGQPGL